MIVHLAYEFLGNRTKIANMACICKIFGTCKTDGFKMQASVCCQFGHVLENKVFHLKVYGFSPNPIKFKLCVHCMSNTCMSKFGIE